MPLAFGLTDGVKLIHGLALEVRDIVPAALLLDLVVLDLADELKCVGKLGLVRDQLAAILLLLYLE